MESVGRMEEVWGEEGEIYNEEGGRREVRCVCRVAAKLTSWHIQKTGWKSLDGVTLYTPSLPSHFLRAEEAVAAEFITWQ